MNTFFNAYSNLKRVRKDSPCILTLEKNLILKVLLFHLKLISLQTICKDDDIVY